MRYRLDMSAMAGAIVLAISLTGCLNLGGRTTYVQENSDTLGRLGVLESRVGALEQSFIRTTASAIPPVSESTEYSRP
jgi:hypothetical protein